MSPGMRMGFGAAIIILESATHWHRMDRSSLVLVFDLAFTLLLWQCKNLADREPAVTWALFLFPAEIRGAAGDRAANARQRLRSGLAFFLWATAFLGVFGLNWYGSAAGGDAGIQSLLRAVMVVCGLFGLLGLAASLWMLARALLRR